jgi:MFS-type transporter involved in bile tolerance (Atg22 family)
MSSFRSPAVALMPDVTIKPLRSKANAVINLMGAAGGIIVLALGLAFGTGKVSNALMSYTPFFLVIAGIMIVSLAIFMLTVREPRFVQEMEEESKRYHLDEEPDETTAEGKELSRQEFKSLLLILASVVLWYMGYNAVTSKYSVYAGKVLNLDYNLTLMIANGAAILSYLPVGILSSKFGRRKMILVGVCILGVAFLSASFMRAGSPVMLMNFLFAMAGIGWATINVNSYPMVVELAKGSDVGKYTGFYYTASMAAQTLTPILSGFLMDWKFTALFPYAAVFVALAFVTMLFVKHGDNKPEAKRGLEAFEDVDG